jgi:signal recognition particle receptor subunit alpha
MLESFLILSRAGVLLWSFPRSPSPEVLAAVSMLITDHVLPDRGLDAPIACGALTLRSAVHLDQLIFVAVAHTQFANTAAAYAQPLLARVREAWLAEYGARACAAGSALLVGSGLEGNDSLCALLGWSSLYTTAATTGAQFAAAFEGPYEDLRDAEEEAQERRGTRKAPSASGTGSSSSEDASPSPSTASPASPSKALKKPSSAKSKQAERTWGFKYSEEAARALDRSKGGGRSSGGDGGGEESGKPSDGAGGEGGGGSVGGGGGERTPAAAEFSEQSRALAGADLAPTSASTAPLAGASWWSRTTSWLSSAVGGSVELTPERLEPVCTQLRSRLVERNVSVSVADQLTAALADKLQGKVVEGGVGVSLNSRLQTYVTDVLRESLERILSPKEPVDLIRDVLARMELNAPLPRAHRDPFVVVFCGVNGVGKSTTLSKVAFMLKEKGAKVLIAACDSYRSGAVEQLKKHCALLGGVELYEQGYQKNPSEIARAGIRRAKDVGADVVLVDTAGRMQNNVSLMKQLAQLVGVNKPDMVLFVGEALVGGDGVDQLREFDRALQDHADGEDVRGIDGIVLTKFDTVDDKVGTAISMVQACNIPIAYLGVGQTYTDIRRLNVAAVLNSLLA